MRKTICKKHDLCTGCTACKNICPTQAISMQDDREGFQYPLINSTTCIDCSLCEKVCPINNPPPNDNFSRISFVARTKDDLLLMACTSGGVFTTLSRQFLEDSGIVYGAIYDENFNVIHQRIINTNDVNKLSGSKYVQSDLGNCFQQIQDDLNNSNKVLFCGTPCQVAGLINFLSKPYENLFVVDLVCHGVPSPQLWREYLTYIQSIKGPLKTVNFRSKKLGYHVSVMEESFANGQTIIGSARTNLMSKCFFRNIADRYSCYNCQFKTVERCSDLTLYDSWHASKLVNGLKDDDKGYTNIIVQSNNGKILIDRYLSDVVELYESDAQRAIELDGSMALASVRMHNKRDEFYTYLCEHGISKAIQKYLPISKKDYLIEKIKVVLYQTKLLYILKRYKK